MEDQTNRLINGRYRLMRLLGEGGMAQVWLAQDESLERLVALKRLRPQFAQDASLLARFRREATTIARLNSPYIVQIYDVGMNQQDSFIVMEYVDGQDLKKLLRLQGALPVPQGLELMRDITAGVATAHEAGLIHRDLKPANILISKRGQIKISDFGIARDLGKAGMTQPGTVWGTSDYMAPEQSRGLTPLPAMDVYSLGVLMFEMLSGQRPYSGDDPMMVMMAHIQQPVPSLRRIAPSVPKNLSVLVARMMAKNPASRPQDAMTLLKILNNYDGSTKTTALRPTVDVTDGSETSQADEKSALSTGQLGVLAPPTEQLDQSDARTGQIGPTGRPTPPVEPSASPERPTRPIEKPKSAAPTRDLSGTPPPASSVDQSQGPTRHWPKTTPPLDSDNSDGATRNWGVGTPGSELERTEGPTRHWPSTPPPSTVEQSQPATHDTLPPFTKDKSEAATRLAGAVPAPAEEETSSSRLMMGGGAVIVLLLLCLFIGMASGGFGALIGGDRGGRVTVTQIAAAPTFTATPTEAPPTATPTVEPSATETIEAEPATVTEPATATVEPSVTATATVEASPTTAVEASATATVKASATATAPIEPSPIPPSSPEPYPYPGPDPTPIRISGPRLGNGADAYALPASTGMTLDGYLSEWNIDEPVYLERVINGTSRWRGPRDLSGIAYFTWDNDYLYLAVERTDNEHLQTETGHELYRDDSIELWIDFDMYGDLSERDANEDDYQFVFSAGDFESLPPEGVTYFPDRSDYGVEVNAVPLFRGYILEARIPWDAVGFVPYEEMVLGYAVVLNDNDSPQEDEPKTQVASSRNEPYLSPYAFGNLILLP